MTKDGLYERYIKERQGIDSIWREDSFVFYRIVGKECFIVDLYVDKEARRAGRCRSLIDQLLEVSKSKACDIITGNLHLKDPGVHTTLLAAYACGFKIAKAENDVLLIVKEVFRGAENG